MQRRIAALALVCFCAGQIGRAQEFKLLNRTVQVHGFFSQGFVKTDENNWLTMNTSQGSFAATDMGLNLSSQVTDRFHVGAQVYDRNLGQLGQWHPALDWAVADYRFANWFGIRAGKVKTTFGLNNDSQDLDFLRVFALLPQGVYPTDLRDATIAHTGGDLYGTLSLPDRLGEVSYTAFAGHRSDSVYSGYPYLTQQWGVFFRKVTGLQYGGDLRWNTPIKGLMLGVSRMNQDITGAGSALNPRLSPPALMPYQVSTKAYWSNQYYGEYGWRKLHIDAEYLRNFNRAPPYPGSDLSSDVRAWYVSGSFHVAKHLELGSYYSRYTQTYVTGGPVSAILPTQTDPALPKNHIYDRVVAARVDLNRLVYVKAEAHFMDGYGFGPYPDGFYPQQNSVGFEPNTNALVLKTGFHF